MMTSPENLEERRVALEVYLNTVLEHDMYREQGDVVSMMDNIVLGEGGGCKKTQMLSHFTIIFSRGCTF